MCFEHEDQMVKASEDISTRVIDVTMLFSI